MKEEKRHKAKIGISRPSCSSGKKYINISLKDVDAHIEFLEIEIDLDNFAEAITGLHGVDCDMIVRGLENVGKKYEWEELVFPFKRSGSYEQRKNEAIEQAQKYVPEGWQASKYYGSQNSFFTRDDVDYARTTIFKWVDKE